MKHLIPILLILCTCAFQVFSFHGNTPEPDSVEFIVSSASVDEGDQFCVDIQLINFIDVASLSLNVKWNPYDYQYISNTGFLINIDPISLIVEENIAKGRLHLLWLAENLLIGQTEPDSTVMVSICFRALNMCGDTSQITLDEKDFLVLDVMNNLLPHTFHSGTLITKPKTLNVQTRVCPADSSAAGSINIMMCGGQAPYIIHYSGPSIGGVDTINRANGNILYDDLRHGVYEFIFLSGAEDTLHERVRVLNGQLHQIETIQHPPTCHYSMDGQIFMEVQPAADYQIEWSHFVFDEDRLTNLENGVYVVEVTDTNRCVVHDTFAIYRDPLHITFEIAADSGGVDSSILIAHVEGGVKPYTFDFIGNPISLDSVIYFLEPKLYHLFVYDANDCMSEATIDLTYLNNSFYHQQFVDFTLSPVPTSSFLTVKGNLNYSSKGGELIIFDVLGKQRMRKPFFGSDVHEVLNVRELDASQYWLTVWVEGKQIGNASFQKN